MLVYYVQYLIYPSSLHLPLLLRPSTLFLPLSLTCHHLLSHIPLTLSITVTIQDCMERTIPYYANCIVPESIAQGKSVLIASSENAIRGLLMHLCEVRK